MKSGRTVAARPLLFGVPDLEWPFVLIFNFTFLILNLRRVCRRQPVILWRRKICINASSVSLFPCDRMRDMTSERFCLVKTSGIGERENAGKNGHGKRRTAGGELPPHLDDGFGEQADVATGIVALVCEGVQLEAFENGVQTMPPGSLPHLPGKIEGVGVFDWAGRQCAFGAGGADERHVEAMTVMGEQRAIAGEARKLAQGGRAGRGLADVRIGNSGVGGDERGDAVSGIHKGGKSFGVKDLAEPDADCGDLDNVVGGGRKSRRFKVKNHQIHRQSVLTGSGLISSGKILWDSVWQKIFVSAISAPSLLWVTRMSWAHHSACEGKLFPASSVNEPS